MPIEERVAKEFGREVQGDMNHLFLGDRLGGGSTREVYVDRLHPSRVVKVEESGFQNVMEHQVWSSVCDTYWAPWFAQVYWISANGRVLIQQRVRQPGKNAPPLPEMVPDFLADVRETNWGLVGKRWVLCDYGHNYLLRCGMRDCKWVDRTEDSVVDERAAIDLCEFGL